MLFYQIFSHVVLRAQFAMTSSYRYGDSDHYHKVHVTSCRKDNFPLFFRTMHTHWQQPPVIPSEIASISDQKLFFGTSSIFLMVGNLGYHRIHCMMCPPVSVSVWTHCLLGYLKLLVSFWVNCTTMASTGLSLPLESNNITLWLKKTTRVPL